MISRLRQKLASSYRLRLTLGYAVLVALLATAWLVSLFGPLTSAVTTQQRSHLAGIARAGAVALASSDATPEVLARRLGAADLRVTIVAADGRVLADSQNAAATMENHAGRPEIAAALAGRTGSDVRLSRTEGVDQMYVAVPATYAGARAVLRVSESLASVSSLAARARATGLLALLAALAVAALVGARLASTAAAPVSRLARSAPAIARGETPVLSPATGELGIVSDALADLSDQVRRRVAEAEAEQANLRAVLDGLDEAVLLLDDGVVRVANGAAGRLFRAPASGWRGVPLSQTSLPAPLIAAVTEACRAATRTTRDIGPDPTGRTLRLTVAPMRPAGTPARTLVIVQDVSERARLDAVRRDFVANASHELKTPAAAIQLLAEAAEAAASDGDAEHALEFVGKMRAEAERLRSLVLDLLDLSRLEQTPSAEGVTDIRGAVDLALAAHRSAAEAKGLTLSSDLSATQGEDVFVAVGPTDVAVALDNLLANAVAYTPGGSVGVTVRASAETVTLEVTDTGVGIPADALPRVFERFFRVDKARSRDSGGTGLGLSLVRHVADRNGGDVRIASEQGSGTTVTLILPRAR